MTVKKSGGKIFGADLTAAERKAMQLEIGREIAKFDQQNMLSIDAVILWELHVQFGFGPKKLRQFYDGFNARFRELIDHYEMGAEDGPYICIEKLREIGVDLEQWDKESEALVIE